MSGLSDLADEFPERRQKRVRRGYRRGGKRFCPHGHEYTSANTIVVVRSGRNPTKRCRKCRAVQLKAWKKRVGYQYPLSYIGRARELLSQAMAIVDADLAARIQALLCEERAPMGFARRRARGKA